MKEYTDDIIESDIDACVFFYDSAHPHEALKPLANEFAVADKLIKHEKYPMVRAYRYDIASAPVP